jgi:signal transduction histidine kinase
MFPRITDDKIVSVTGFFRDVSERKKSEEKLSESRARTEFFVDCMVHDITNINQEVLSVIELLLMNPDFPEHLKDLVTEALDEVDRGSNLVENVRKISSLYSMTPKVEYHDLWTTLTTAAKKVDDSFSNKELVLETNISENQYHVKADEFFADVFYSLLHNSVKFDTKTKVNVEVNVGEIKHTPFVRIEVKDQGPGIPDEEKESLFDKISHRRDSIAGLGLGLSLVKMALDNYGAYINIEDRVEGDHTKGANFIILLRHEPKSEEGKEVSE